MSKPFLTIGCATYNDFNGVYFTVQAHRMYQDTRDCEFIIVDNNPDSPEGQATRDFIQSISHIENIRYIPYTEIGGTSQPRNKIIEEAQGDFVMVTDPHVFVQANGIHLLKKHLREATPEMQKNLFTGPLLYDGLSFVSTHFEIGFQDQMNGTWATAWRHPDGTAIVCKNFDNRVHLRKLHVESKGEWTPTEIPWPSHEQQLIDRGYKVMGMTNDEPPFEIPGQGFGLFVTSKEHWIPFNRDFRGFGGEEILHHALYRKHGRTTYCLPFIKWVHRFGRPGGVPYPLTMENKIRNYLIGYKDVDWDTEEVRKHFVDEVKFPQATFDIIARDPVAFQPFQPRPRANGPAPAAAAATSNLGFPLPTNYETLNDVVNFVAQAPRDLNEHAGLFMKWLIDMHHAVDITGRRESTALLLGALGRKIPCRGNCDKSKCDKRCDKPAVLVSFQQEQDSLIGILQDMVKTHPGRPLEFSIAPFDHSKLVDEIPETDFLFLDTVHSGERVLEELTRYAPKVSSRIMIHDTAIFGVDGEGGGKGMFWGISQFINQNPEWFIAEHAKNQYGMTVLSRLPSDKPKDPVKLFPGMLDPEGKLCGCGQELKATLKLIGIEAAPGCSCNARAAMMDDWGPAKCREELETILDWLKEEADKRNMGHLYVRPVVKLAVLRAIRAAEKKIEKGLCK
jgi:hypothetical protein